MKINRYSWHYKWLAFSSVAGSLCNNFHTNHIWDSRVRRGLSFTEIYEEGIHEYRWSAPSNVCQYIRALLIPIAKVLINIAIIIGLIAFILFIGVGTVALTILGSAVLILLLMLGLGAGVYVKENSSKIHDKIAKSDGFIKAAYDMYKKRICTLVEINKDEK